MSVPSMGFTSAGEGKIIYHCIKHGLHTFIFKGRAPQHGHYFIGQRALSEPALNIILAEVSLFEIGVPLARHWLLQLPRP